jgi:AraC-like DNA-binding protein
MPYLKHSLFQEIETQLSKNANLSLQDLSRCLGTNRYYVQKTVYETQKISFRQLKNSKRLERSLELLMRMKELRIKEIAAILDWSQSGFSRFIKQTTGKTPTQIKRSTVLAS